MRSQRDVLLPLKNRRFALFFIPLPQAAQSLEPWCAKTNDSSPEVQSQLLHVAGDTTASSKCVGVVWCCLASPSLLRGSSRQSGLNELIGGIWFHEVHATLLLFWRVPSKLQVEDGHCRQLGGCTPFLSVRSGGEAPAVCRDTLRSARG